LLTVEGEDFVDDVVLDVPEATAGRRLVGVRENAAAERRVELDVLADQLRPEPRHLFSSPAPAAETALIFSPNVLARRRLSRVAMSLVASAAAAAFIAVAGAMTPR